MAESFAYVTGGASGIGKGVVEMLVKNNVKVFIADRNVEGARDLANELNAASKGVAEYGEVDIAEWESQEKSFSQAVAAFGRIDHVYAIAGIGERAWIPNDPDAPGFTKPDLTVIDVDLNGVLYTVALAVQQFRKQKPGKNGLRGKIGTVASVCGYYAIPTLPIYSAAKYGVTGLVRTYGKYLPEENIILNSVNPHVVRTNISTSQFYEQVDSQNLLTPVSAVVETFEILLKDDKSSGECYEVGPNYSKNGPVPRKVTEYLDKETQVLADICYHRGWPLHQPKKADAQATKE